MTNPQHEALVEAVAREADSRLDAIQRIAEKAGCNAYRLEKALNDLGAHVSLSAALSATAATPSDDVVRLRAALEEISDYNIRSWQGQHAYRTIYGQEAYERVVWPAVGAPIDPPDTVARLQSALKGILGSGKAGTWKAATEPLVARFDVAAKFGGDTVHNQDGSAALAELLRSMAETLDTAVHHARAALEPQGQDL